MFGVLGLDSIDFDDSRIFRGNNPAHKSTQSTFSDLCPCAGGIDAPATARAFGREIRYYIVEMIGLHLWRWIFDEAAEVATCEGLRAAEIKRSSSDAQHCDVFERDGPLGGYVSPRSKEGGFPGSAVDAGAGARDLDVIQENIVAATQADADTVRCRSQVAHRNIGKNHPVRMRCVKRLVRLGWSCLAKLIIDSTDQPALTLDLNLIKGDIDEPTRHGDSTAASRVVGCDRKIAYLNVAHWSRHEAVVGFGEIDSPIAKSLSELNGGAGMKHLQAVVVDLDLPVRDGETADGKQKT